MSNIKIRLRVDEILKEKGVSKYALQKMLDMDYDNMNKMIRNQTKAIRYETLEKLCNALNCTVGELFDEYNNAEDK